MARPATAPAPTPAAPDPVATSPPTVAEAAPAPTVAEEVVAVAETVAEVVVDAEVPPGPLRKLINGAAKLVIGFIDHEIESVPDHNGVTHSIRVHTPIATIVPDQPK